MPSNPSQLVGEALEAESKNFNQLVGDAIQLLEQEDGQVGDFTVFGRLIRMRALGEAIVVSDLHGDLESLTQILKETDFTKRAEENRRLFLIFLGDYGDRGIHSAEVYYIVLKLKLLFPEQVILMRGNHEGPEDLLASPHDLPFQFQARFGRDWKKAYSTIRGLFNHLYNAVMIEKRYLLIHGGLPSKAETLEDLAYAHLKHPKKKLLEDMLWSDPAEDIQGVCESPRGAGKLFGDAITTKSLKRFNVKVLIRGHQPTRNGFKINHGCRILTLFSRRGSPYFNVHGAYLHVDLSKDVDDARQLIPFIRIL